MACCATLAAAASAGSIKTVATVTIASGANAGTYSMESDQPCEIHPPADGNPTAFSIRMNTPEYALGKLRNQPTVLGAISVDVPNISSSQHLGELSVSITFGDPQTRRTPGTAHFIDTIPPGATQSLKEFEELLKREGEVRKRTGRGGAMLADHGASAKLDFWGETAQRVSFKGSIDCRRVSHD
jgi:hypothetical protein